jgi:hypothetical protein
MGVLLFLLAIWAVLSFIPATLAQNKGRSFGGFWCLSFFVPFGFFIALIVALCSEDKSQPKPPTVVYMVQGEPPQEINGNPLRREPKISPRSDSDWSEKAGVISPRRI